MARKAPERGKQGHLYDELSYGINNSLNLERNLSNLLTIAPVICKKVGITSRDVSAAKRISKNQRKILYALMNGEIKLEDIK